MLNAVSSVHLLKSWKVMKQSFSRVGQLPPPPHLVMSTHRGELAELFIEHRVVLTMNLEIVSDNKLL